MNQPSGLCPVEESNNQMKIFFSFFPIFPPDYSRPAQKACAHWERGGYKAIRCDSCPFSSIDSLGCCCLAPAFICCFANRSSSGPPVLPATSCLLFLFCSIFYYLLLLLLSLKSCFQLARLPRLSCNGVGLSCYIFILNRGDGRNKLSNGSIIRFGFLHYSAFRARQRGEKWGCDNLPSSCRRESAVMINEARRQN